MRHPKKDEYAAYYHTYVDKVPDGDIIKILKKQSGQIIKLLKNVSKKKSLFRYAPEKWSVREIIGHIIDTERVLSYRALRFARNDQNDLPGFDENAYVRQSNYNDIKLGDLVEEFCAIRKSNVMMFKNFSDERRKFECGLYEGVKEVVQKIDQLGIGQSILSAYSQHTLDEMVEYYGLTKYFTHIVGLDNIYAAGKLHLGKDLMKRLGNGKGETLLIGDTEHDYEVATEIGADCILSSNGHQSSEKLERLSCLVVDDIRNIFQ